MRTLGLAVSTAFLLVSCSSSVTTPRFPAVQIEEGSALNARTGTYHVGDVTVRLTKVVDLPGNELGLRFVFLSDLRGCCNVFPHVAGQAGASSAPGTTSHYVVVLDSDVGDDGTLALRLSDGEHPTAPFTVDLAALGVDRP